MFAVYQKFKNCSEMASWLLPESKSIGSPLSHWWCRKAHQPQKEALEEQQTCGGPGANSTAGIAPPPKLQVSSIRLISKRRQRPRRSSPWHGDTACEWRCEKNRQKGGRYYVQCGKKHRSGKSIRSAYFGLWKKGTWKDSILFKPHAHVMKSGCFKIRFRIYAVLLQ